MEAAWNPTWKASFCMMSIFRTPRFALLHRSCRKYGDRMWLQGLRLLPDTQDRCPFLHSIPLPQLIWCILQKLPFLQPPPLWSLPLLTLGVSSTCHPLRLRPIFSWWISWAMLKIENCQWCIWRLTCRAWDGSIFVLTLWGFQTPAYTLLPIFPACPATLLCFDCVRKYYHKIVFPFSSSARSKSSKPY